MFVKMSVKSERLRGLVCQRLSATAENICALFERTIAEYEEELRRCKEENERKQKLLDALLSPRVLVYRADVQIDDPSLKQITTKTAQTEGEQSIKQEEQEIIVVSGKSEHREETQGEDYGRAEADTSLDPHGRLHSETEEQTDNDEDWEPPASGSTQHMKTEADGDHPNQVQMKDKSTAASSTALFTKYKSAVETHDTGRGKSGAGEGRERKKRKSSICQKSLKTKKTLSSHMKVNLRRTPGICSVCKKAFVRKDSLTLHMRIHTGEKPYSCSECKKAFNQKGNLKVHMRIHTGEKPYSCSDCKKAFNRQETLKGHMRTHTGEKSYSCSACKKAFSKKSSLKTHLRTHTEA